jgi:hypothetical protein
LFIDSLAAVKFVIEREETEMKDGERDHEKESTVKKRNQDGYARDEMK